MTYLLLLSSFFLAAIPARASRPFVAQIFKMPEAVEPAAVTTAGHYILVHHLVRPLTKLDKFGKIQGNLAVKWQASADHRTWMITLGTSKFSNGEAIQASDVIATIERQRRLGGGVHFKFSEISKAEALDSTTVRITLASPHNDFVSVLSAPEFGVLYGSDAAAGKGLASFSVTSGAYSISGKEGRSYRLKRNPNFHSDALNENDLILESAGEEQSVEDLSSGKVDFLTPHGSLSGDQHERLMKGPKVRGVLPHIGFSYWLSLNPKSSALKSAAAKAFLQKVVQEFQSPDLQGHQWERARQLYLPDGNGRPSSAELDKIWKKIGAKAKAPEKTRKTRLRVISLRDNEKLVQDLLGYLGKWYEIELVSHKSEEELISLIKDGNFDLKIQSNDFSSLNLTENLKVCFNEVRPYIFLEKNSKVRKLLREATETADREHQDALFKEIGITLLLDGTIAPFAYNRIWFYMSQNLDTSPWSNIYPEISFWKVKAP